MSRSSTLARTRTADQSRVVLAALRKLLKDPTTPNYQACAREVATLRSLVMYDGRPDWRGQSPEYKDVITRLYRLAEMPSDSAGHIQANLRYHIGNAVREMAPSEDIEALGLSTDGPLARARKSRGARNGDETSALALAQGALRNVRAVKAAGVTPDVAAILTKIIKEAADALGNQGS